MVDNVQEHTRCAPFRCRCEPSRARGRHQLSRTLPQVQAQSWDQPIRARPHRLELGMALWLVALACGCGLWLWPVTCGCGPWPGAVPMAARRNALKSNALAYAKQSFLTKPIASCTQNDHIRIGVLTGWRPLLAPRGCPRSFLARQPKKKEPAVRAKRLSIPWAKNCGAGPHSETGFWSTRNDNF